MKIDHVQIANSIIESVGTGNMLATDSATWEWDGYKWWRIPAEEERYAVRDRIRQYTENPCSSEVDKVVEAIHAATAKANHKFNIGNPTTISVENGEVSLGKTGIWTLYPHNREHYRTVEIPVTYDPTATAPRFEQFMREIFKGDADASEKTKAILEMMAYTLMTHTKHKRFIILLGNGANGKSVLTHVLQGLCGFENIAGVHPSVLSKLSMRARLHLKLANFANVGRGKALDGALIESFVSGEPMTVRHKFQKPFNMEPFATLWFEANRMPKTQDHSDALLRRTLVVPFNNAFKNEDSDWKLKAKLLRELPGILNLALAAYSNAVLNGFTTPDSCIAARAEWLSTPAQTSDRRPGTYETASN
ncbi:MAG: hypothetical protein NMNS01_23360 [Nitrosomonas sp.]|nr:MAG: hypothetical protein NMNS01_23360 [Nitrosomonas sp.]